MEYAGRFGRVLSEYPQSVTFRDDRKQSVAQETAVLARVIFPEDFVEDDPLEEVRGLAETAGTVVAGPGVTQRREKPDVSTFVGKGKLAELKRIVSDHDADVVLFDNNLGPAQTRNLEQELKVKVIDRTELILDIFATHAQTYESRLAVELAQLEYSLPRLKRMWTHLSRMKAGVGTRGPGEKQLEEDRRLVERRIADLKRELQSVERRRERMVEGRSGTPTVSLVGYTNAGKSTLMNSLTDANVYAANKLFATIGTRTRRWKLPNWGPVLLSDTVGFIRDLPHQLIASFKATLEEARQADLLLHVADASNPNVLNQITAVYDVLSELEISEKDTLLVLNKIDRMESRETLGAILERYPSAISVSAATGEGFARLNHAVSDHLSRYFLDLEVDMFAGNGKLLAYLSDRGEVLSTRLEDDRTLVHVKLPARYFGPLRDADDVKVTCKSGSLPDFSAEEERRNLRDLRRRLRRGEAEGIEDEEESSTLNGPSVNGHAQDGASNGKSHANGVSKSDGEDAEETSRDDAWRLDRMQGRSPASGDGRASSGEGRASSGDSRS